MIEADIYRDGVRVTSETFTVRFTMSNDIPDSVYHRAHKWADRQIEIMKRNEIL